MNPAILGARPATWKLVLALTLVYLSWGTTYFAIREGVKTLPPGLFGGVRLFLAGLALLGYQALRGGELRLSWRETAWAALVGGLMFIGGNGLVTAAEKTVPSGVAALLVATTPLGMALLETLWPRGERLTPAGWVGVVAGLGGVAILWSDQWRRSSGAVWADAGPFLVLGSAGCWALGSFLHRRSPRRGPHLTTAAYHMLLGGGGLSLLGAAVGETRDLTPAAFTPAAVAAFFYLLVVGSLIGFTAYAWLLGNTSAVLAGTYAYVNPVVALLVGWLLGGEPLTFAVAGGMVVILAGVALVRLGGAAPARNPVFHAPPRRIDNDSARCYLQNQAPPSS